MVIALLLQLTEVTVKRDKGFLLAMSLDIGNIIEVKIFNAQRTILEILKNSSKEKEREADQFSADLLMPWFLFKPIARDFENADFNTVLELRKRFKTSESATAIRLVESDIFPTVLICHDQNKRQWFKRSNDIPRHWFPPRQFIS